MKQMNMYSSYSYFWKCSKKYTQVIEFEYMPVM